MTSRYEVTLGGKKLSSVNKNLLILDVQYGQPETSQQEYQIANLDGLDLGRKVYKRRTVTVTFELHIYGTAERNAACQAVTEWAMAGGTLRTSDRAGQYLTVECTQFPQINSVRGWTEPLTVVFSTVGIPYWQSDTKNALTISGTTARGTLKVGGNTGTTPVTVTITAKAMLRSVQITVGSSTIKLTDIRVPTSRTLEITYTKDRYLRVRANGENVMKNIDPASSDTLLATCGASNAVTITASANMTAVLEARGRYL